MSIRNLGIAACVLWSALQPMAALAQAFPSKPITVVWPFPPGLSSETKMRAMYAEASKTLGQPIVMEYRPGAGGRLGVVAVQKAAPDGHTMAFATDVVLAVLAQSSASFRVQVDKDYMAVHQPFGVPLVITAHPSLPFRDLKGWVAYAKANPGKLTYASTGIGGSAHLSMERILSALDIQMTHVPYSATPFQSDLLTGTFDMMAYTALTFKPHIDAGKLVAIAQAGPRRVRMFPNTPTLKESGYDLSMESWTALVTAPGTPRDIVARLNSSLNAAQKSPEVAKLFAADESIVFYTSPQEITEHIKAEQERYRPIAQRLNLKFD